MSGGSLDRVGKVDAHGLKKYEMCSVSIVGVLEHPLVLWRIGKKTNISTI